jgi:GAF domain-containing protein
MSLMNLFRLRRTFANAFDEQQARVLYVINAGMLLFAIFGVGVSLSAARERYDTFRIIVLGSLVSANPLIFLPIVLVVCGLTLLLLRRGALNAARTVFMIGVLFAAILLNFLVGENTMQSRTLLGYIVPLVAAGVLLGRSGTLIVTATVLAAIFTQALAIALGILNYPPTPPTPAYLPFIFATLSVSGVMLYVFSGSQRSLLRTSLNLESELRGITALSRLVGEGATVERLLNETVTLLHEKLGYYHVQIFLVEERSGVLSLAASTGGASERDGVQRRLPPNSPSVIAEAVRTGRTQRIAADAPAARRAEFVAAVRTELVVPLRVGDEAIGALDLQSTSDGAFLSREIEALETLATQLALAIRNVRLQAALQLANRDQQQLIEQVRTASREIERLNQEASGRAWQLYLQSRSEKAISFDWDGNMITPGTRPIRLPARGAYGYMPYIEARDGAQYLVVPIVSRGQALGVMEFRAPDGQFWDDRSLELTRAIAQRLALSLDNLRLYDQAQMAITREQIANRVATLLQAKSDVDTLVAVAVDAFQQALGAVQTSVRLGLPPSLAPDASLSNGRPESGADS